MPTHAPGQVVPFADMPSSVQRKSGLIVSQALQAQLNPVQPVEMTPWQFLRMLAGTLHGAPRQHASDGVRFVALSDEFCQQMTHNCLSLAEVLEKAQADAAAALEASGVSPISAMDGVPRVDVSANDVLDQAGESAAEPIPVDDPVTA